MKCEICGTKENVRICPIMTGDTFGEKPKHPVCKDCIRTWYESGLTDRDKIREYVLKEREAE